MKVTKSDLTKTKVKLTISGDQFDLTPIKNHVLTHFAEKVRVPGFRAGTAPAALVEKYADPQALNDEFIQHALDALYGKAIHEQKLRPASRPDVKLMKFVPFTDLEFNAEFDVLGAIKLPNYKTIKVAKKTTKVTPNEVDDVINMLLERASERSEVERSAKKDDEVTIDFSGKDEKNQPIANTDGKDVPLVIGSDAFIPGFEEELIGLKSGDKKSFKITFPQDYGVKSMQSKKVTFDVEVKKVSEMKKPKLDDKFVASVGPFKSVSELKTDIKKQLTLEKEQQAMRTLEDELLRKLADKMVMEIPASMIDEQVQSAEDQEKRNLASKGQTWQEHLDEEGLSEKQHREKQRPEAELRVKIGLLLAEVAEKEQISVSQEEVDVKISQLKAQYNDPSMQAELDKEETRQEIGSRLLTEKTVLKLISFAQK